MMNPDLSDFLHAAGFYAVSVFIAFLAAVFESLGSRATSFGGMFVAYYAFVFLALLSLGGFVLGSVSAYAGVLSLKGGDK
jgi:hypothetical protein